MLSYYDEFKLRGRDIYRPIYVCVWIGVLCPIMCSMSTLYKKGDLNNLWNYWYSDSMWYFNLYVISDIINVVIVV